MSNVDPLAEIPAALASVQLIPDVLPPSPSASFTPSVLFSVVWPSGKRASLGNELTRDDTLDEPDIVFAGVGEGEGEEPKYKEFRHWVITGLKYPAGTSDQTGTLSAVKTKPSTTPYRPPGPPPGSGLHRYVFLLFEEPAGAAEFSIPEGSTEYGAALEERRSWGAVKFGETYGLKLVGATYFLVRSVD
ncbi:PEBP-like superfamily protein [Pleurotus pulmonarius]